MMKQKTLATKLQSIHLKNLFSIFLALGLSAILVNCGGDKDSTPTDTIQPTFNSLYNKVFEPACASCHQPGQSAYDTDGILIDFSDASTAYIDITTKNAQGIGAATCAGVNYIAASDADNSYLAAVVIESVATGFNNGGCTTPLNSHYTGTTNLSAAEQQALINWINNGAQNN